MKRIMTLLACAVFAAAPFSLGGCGARADYRVGIIQLVQHVALDQVNEGFCARLKQKMDADGKTLRIYNKNACNDMSSCITISQSLVTKNVDCILGIATAAAQAAATAASNRIPVLFSAVTDAVSAGLVKSNETPWYNVSGVSDINPVPKQIELCKDLSKGNPKIGFLFTNSEVNSQKQLEMAQAAAEELGVEIIAKGINDLNDLGSVYNYLVSKDVGAIYIPTDNLMASAAATVHVNNKMGAKLPIVCGEVGMNTECGIATYGVDYYALGERAADMAYDIIVNGADARELAVKDMLDKAPFELNEKIAEELGFEIPQSVLDRQ